MNSNLFSPKSRGVNDSNLTKSNANEKGTIIENNSQKTNAGLSKTNSKVSVQVSRVFLNMVDSLLKNI